MSLPRLFAPDEPRAFTTAPGESFALSVAGGLRDRLGALGADPLAIADVVLVASTQRAIRGLRSAFAHVSGGVSFTPRMTALADLDADLLDPEGKAESAEEAPIPPAVHPMRRHLLLARLVRAVLLREDAGGGPILGAPVIAPQLAQDLAALLDDCYAAGVPLEKLPSLAPDKHAAHWALSQQFLKILTEAWPAILADQPGAPIDPGDRRRRQLARLKRLWAERPPMRPVIVAGSPTDPAAAELIAAIAALPQGAVVLPGYDLSPAGGALLASLEDAAAETHAASPPAGEHPQAALVALVRAMGLDPAPGGPRSVRLWRGAPAGPDLAPRQRLLSQALRPAPATDGWRAAAAAIAAEAGAATAGLSLLEAASPREEAAAIALALREALETPGRRAALITPDRTLARRVAAELARWGVKPDDSSGRPLALTPPGVFLTSVLDCARADFASAALLALLKHPLAGAGFPRGAHLRMARRLEREALRGAPRMAGLDGAAALKARLAALAAAEKAAGPLAGEVFLDDEDASAGAPDRPETPAPDALGLGPDPRGEAGASDLDLLPWFDRIAEILAPLTALMKAESAPLAALVAAHEAAARALSVQAGPQGRGRETLYEKIAGETLARFLATLADHAEAFGEIAPQDYPALLSGLMAQEAVREPFGRHPRALILGALEARMTSADLVILAGLNEGVWPKPPELDAWLSRDMRRALGLPPLEARIGLSAHDFTLAAQAPEAILSRTRKADGAPTTPSRWLLRLTNLLTGVAPEALAAMTGRGEAILARLDRLDAGPPGAAPDPALRPAPRPRPAPPLAARPTRFSVTEVETLIRDPYAIYAKKTLRLSALDPLEPEPDARDRGQALHAAMEGFVRETIAERALDLPAARARYDRIAEEALRDYAAWPTLHAFWSARLAQIRDWFLDGEAERRAFGAPAALESSGAMRLDTALGAAYLTGKADRIDRIVDEERGAGYAIYDYKAGAPPSEKERAAFAKQLPLEAAILAAEGFAGAPAGPVAKLAYLSLSGGSAGGAETVLEGDPATLAAEAIEGLRRLLGGYADPRLGYAARLRPQHIAFASDYDHLSRLGEWRPEDETGLFAEEDEG